MQFHICYDEINMVLMLVENTRIYLFHYWHITKTFFVGRFNKDCKVCTDELEE